MLRQESVSHAAQLPAAGHGQAIEEIKGAPHHRTSGSRGVVLKKAAGSAAAFSFAAPATAQSAAASSATRAAAGALGQPAAQPVSAAPRRKIKVSVDYGSYPLWRVPPEGYGDLNPDSLNISAGLKADLMKWARTYHATLNLTDPQLCGFSSPAKESEFLATGEILAARLQRELPDFLILRQDD